MNENQQISTQKAISVEAIDKTTGLTPLQERCAVLMASGTTITDIAKELGLDRGTLYQWLKKVTFQCYLNYLKKTIQDNMTGKLFDLHSSAMEAIQKCLFSDNENIRFKTAVWIIEKLYSSEVGEGDVRKELEKECTHSGLMEGWNNYLDKEEYKQRLAEEGLDDI